MNITSRIRTVVKMARVQPSKWANRAYLEITTTVDTKEWITTGEILTTEEAELQHAQLVMGTHEKYVLKPK